MQRAARSHGPSRAVTVQRRGARLARRAAGVCAAV